MTGKQDEARRKKLRRMLQNDAVTLTVAADELRWLLDEASRLQQSNDRLRRQNGRLRVRLEAAGGVADPGEDEPA